jgi:alkylhydroperoxidase/carboxymuconolactone decarboxylase family protein YurZ
MTKATIQIENITIDKRIETLIAIGAAIASNCIPCFEHLYERAITCGLTAEQIKKASDIAGQVRRGAQTALSSSVNELIGDKGLDVSSCMQMANKSYRG